MYLSTVITNRLIAEALTHDDVMKPPPKRRHTIGLKLLTPVDRPNIAKMTIRIHPNMSRIVWLIMNKLAVPPRVLLELRRTHNTVALARLPTNAEHRRKTRRTIVKGELRMVGEEFGEATDTKSVSFKPELL
jgi:hypothetical protein